MPTLADVVTISIRANKRLPLSPSNTSINFMLKYKSKPDTYIAILKSSSDEALL